MSFQAIALSEPGMANVTFIRLFSGVNSQMPLELERIRAGVSAVAALVGTLAGMTAHVSLELAQLYTLVIALAALVRLLMSMPEN